MVLGVGVASGFYISSYRVTHRVNNWAPCFAKGYNPTGFGSSCFVGAEFVSHDTRPSWVVPVSVLVGFAGLAGCAGILRGGDRRGGRLRGEGGDLAA